LFLTNTIYFFVGWRRGLVACPLAGVISQANCMWPFSLATHGADDVLVIMHGEDKKRPIDQQQQRRRMNTAPQHSTHALMQR